jgi:hypothetical protein
MSEAAARAQRGAGGRFRRRPTIAEIAFSPKVRQHTYA